MFVLGIRRNILCSLFRFYFQGAFSLLLLWFASAPFWFLGDVFDVLIKRMLSEKLFKLVLGHEHGSPVNPIGHRDHFWRIFVSHLVSQISGNFSAFAGYEICSGNH